MRRSAFRRSYYEVAVNREPRACLRPRSARHLHDAVHPDAGSWVGPFCDVRRRLVRIPQPARGRATALAVHDPACRALLPLFGGQLLREMTAEADRAGSGSRGTPRSGLTIPRPNLPAALAGAAISTAGAHARRPSVREALGRSKGAIRSL